MKMKKKKPYCKPEMRIEQFTPNEYIAVCGGENDWTIACNVPNGFGFKDNNNNGKYDEGDTYIVKGWGCGTSHTTTLPEGETPSSDGYMWQPVKILDTWDVTDQWNWNGSAYAAIHFYEKGAGDSDDHFSIASKGDWHKTNLS